KSVGGSSGEPQKASICATSSRVAEVWLSRQASTTSRVLATLAGGLIGGGGPVRSDRGCCTYTTVGACLGGSSCGSQPGAAEAQSIVTTAARRPLLRRRWVMTETMVAESRKSASFPPLLNKAPARPSFLLTRARTSAPVDG